MIITHEEFKDLAPTIVRRRLIIECIYKKNKIHQKKIYNYMVELSDIMNMTIVSLPVTNFVEEYGFSAYMSWKESGMHVYTWNENSERPNFMSIDIYTCKNFEIQDVIEFTKKSFNDEITEITWRE